MRAITVSVGPLASAVANNIATSQTIPTGGGTVALNGALVTNTFQTSGASFINGNVLNVATVTSGVLNIGDTLIGLGVQANTRVIGPLSPTTNQAGKYILNVNYTVPGFTCRAGCVATLDTPRRVIITSAGNDSGITFTITGTDWSGSPISEVVTGGNIAAASSVLDYATITSIVASAATASTITVGTNGVAASPWVRFDDYGLGTVAAQFSVTGTANFSYQTAFDEGPASTAPYQRANTVWDTSGTTIVNATATVTTSGAPPRLGRVLLNSGSGSVLATFVQLGTTPD